MLILEVSVGLLAILVSFMGFLFALQPTRDTPIVEMRLLTGAMLLQVIALISFLPIAWLASPTLGINPSSQVFYRIFVFFSVLVLLCLQLTFYLPNFTTSYRHIFYLIILIFLDSTYLFLSLFEEFPLFIQGEFMKVQTESPSLSGPLAVIAFGIIIVLLYYRVREIQDLTNERSFFLFSPKYLFFLIGLILMALSINAAITLDPELPLPLHFGDLINASMFTIIAFGFRQNHHAFFLVPVKLHAIIVTDQKTGLVLYADSFDPDSPADELLGMLMTSLNLSLKETIQSHQDMEEISFGDKVIHLTPGDRVTSLFIVSTKTLMTATLSRYITRTFENQFHTLLETSSDVIHTADYEPFKQRIDLVKKYFAVQA